MHRSTWTRADATWTDWVTADGALYRKESGKPLRFFERKLESILLHPLPAPGLLDSGILKLDSKMIPEGQKNLACVGAALQSEYEDKKQSPSLETGARYCFDLLTMALRTSYSGMIATEFDHVVKIQGRYLARQVAISDGGKPSLFSASVETIEWIDSSDAMLSPPADAVLVRAATSQATPSQTGSAAKGFSTNNLTFFCPTNWKKTHEQNVVLLAAMVGTDGRVHDMEVLASPSPLLSNPAVDAVKKWIFGPYQLNGTAVEVETVVDVIFVLDHQPGSND